MTTERESARPLSELDRGTHARLEALLGVDAHALTADDKAFLAARKDYLTAGQRRDLGVAPKASEPEKDEPKQDTVPTSRKRGTK